MNLTLFFIWVLSEGFTAVHSDVFSVKVYGDKVQVISPGKWSSAQSVVVENKTMVDILGKVVLEERPIKYVAIKAGKFATVEIKSAKKTKAFFVSMAPAFQEIELLAGNKYYEIPPEN
ncbi:MAG: hypothetical protein OXB84_04780 [Halobacteriovoraceae bacterium]|nr:hypothetical protein [Halobacteriovoraceae bacterium]